MKPDTAQFTLTRAFGISPERLWPLLTDANARSVWAGPSDDHVLVADQIDLREGGLERHRCGPVEAPDYTVETVWYRINTPHLACFSETVDAGGARIATSLVTYGVAPKGKGALLTVVVFVSSFVGMRPWQISRPDGCLL